MFEYSAKKVSFIILSITIFSLSFAATPAGAAAFTDIGIGHEHYVAINYLKENGLIEGYEDGTFQPRREINRAEALKILMLAFNDIPDPSATAELPFNDVNSSDWFYPYVLSAWSNEIISGYPEGHFHPEQTINIAESLKIALLEEGNPLPESIDEQPFNDIPVDAWFAPYAQVAEERTLFLESRQMGNLYPGKNVNRGTFAELIYRLLKSNGPVRFARATWYGNEFADWGTASGEKFDPDKLTAAHKTLPFGTRLLVTNLANNEKVEVIVNDRGPYARGMDLDLSRSAFEAIASLGAGIINTEFQEIPNIPEYAF